MKKYDIIAFDLDGTLTDPENGLVEGFIYAFKKFQMCFQSIMTTFTHFVST